MLFLTKGTRMNRQEQSDRFTIVDAPTEQELTLIEAGLNEHNLARTGGAFHFPGNEEPGLAFDLAVKGPDGTIVGGINVSSILGVMWLEVLWVAEEHRRRGLAGWLVLEAERIAREKGCVGAATWTFDWQGADFYPRIGFELRGVYDGYPFGMTEHVLAKRLPSLPRVRETVERHVTENRRQGYALVAEPTKDEMKVVHLGLRAHCVAHVGDGETYAGSPVRLALRDENGDLAGGLTATTPVHVLALEQLWVAEPYRGLGHGRRLIEEAERIARSEGCVAAQGCCLRFQAPGFFRRVGYESFGTVDVYVDGYVEELLIKRFEPEADT